MYNYFYFLYLQPAPPIDDEADDAHPLEEAESEMDMSGPFNSDTDDGSFHSVCRSDSESESDAEVQEPSLLEETLPPEYYDDEGTVTYELVERGTQRRALLLIDSLGYSYGKYDRTKAGQKWRCTQRNAAVGPPCNAQVLQEGDQTFSRWGNHEHTHAPTSGKATKAKAVRDVKEQCSKNPFKSAFTIAESVTLGNY